MDITKLRHKKTEIAGPKKLCKKNRWRAPTVTAYGLVIKKEQKNLRIKFAKLECEKYNLVTTKRELIWAK